MEKNISQNSLQSYIFHISEAKHSSLFAKLFFLVGFDISVALTLCHWILFPHLLSALAIHPHPGLWQHFVGKMTLFAGGQGKKTKGTGVISLCIFVFTSLQVLLRCWGQKRLWVDALQNSEEKAFRLSLEPHINTVSTTQVERGQARQRHQMQDKES